LRNEPDSLIGRAAIEIVYQRDGYLPSHLNLPPAMRFAAPSMASLAHTSSTVAEPRGAGAANSAPEEGDVSSLRTGHATTQEEKGAFSA
jgi:hypothetical protein